MYSLRDYGSMIVDEARVALYAEALRRAVKPGSVVLDIGTGPGVLALLACHFGAGRVYAVEPGDVIGLAREIAAANELTDRIEFVQGLTTDVELERRADVIVAEIHGILPLFEKSLVTMIDARKRLLAPGGTLIPCCETLWASVVHAPAIHSFAVAPWGRQLFGIDMRLGRRRATGEIYRAELGADAVLAPPAAWATLDYRTLESPDVESRVVLHTDRAGEAHGIALWFESQLAEGVIMSAAPGKPVLIYGQAFLPWPQPVELAVADTIELDIGAKLLGERYIWRWHSRVVSGGQERAAFRQSQLDAALIVPEKLRRHASTHVPKLTEEGEIERLVLDRMAASRPLGEIAGELRERYAARYPRWEDALGHVGEIAQRCSD